MQSHAKQQAENKGWSWFAKSNHKGNFFFFFAI